MPYSLESLDIRQSIIHWVFARGRERLRTTKRHQTSIIAVVFFITSLYSLSSLLPAAYYPDAMENDAIYPRSQPTWPVCRPGEGRVWRNQTDVRRRLFLRTPPRRASRIFHHSILRMTLSSRGAVVGVVSLAAFLISPAAHQAKQRRLAAAATGMARTGEKT